MGQQAIDFGAALKKQEDIAKNPFKFQEDQARTTEVAVSELSLDRIRPQFKDYKEKAEKILADAKAVEITDEGRQKFAVSLGGEASKLAKVVDAKRKEFTADATDFINGVKNIAAMIIEPLNEAVRLTKEKNNQYSRRLEVERLEAKKKAEEAAKKLQDEINADAKKKGVEAPQVVAPTIPQQQTKVRTENGTTAYEVKRWVATIINADEVPREYCTPDMRIINDKVKGGVRTIPGVKIEEVTDTRYR